METMLHITCYGQSEANLREILKCTKSFGVNNVMALRGDPPKGKQWIKDAGDCNYASEFVRIIRSQYPTTAEMVVAVAGYPPPRGHPDSTSYEDDLVHLKEKVDAGANMIITQLFFRAVDFIQFVKDCRNMGIDVPIIPGIFPIQAYNSVRQVVALAKSQIPDEAMAVLEANKQNDEAIRNFGIDYAVDLCRELLASGYAPGLHFYTLNRDVATLAIVKRLGLYRDTSVQRPLPWRRQTANKSRTCQELVRPIFWANHPRSYVYRTLNWDEYPNGRWGDSSAAAFGDYNHHAFYIRHLDTTEGAAPTQRAMWGENLQSEMDAWDVFVRFISDTPGPNGVKVARLPWSESETLLDETRLISCDLMALNQGGMLTINSQPSANGVDSSDPVFGWGAPNGVIYQKAYLEFFMPRCYVKAMLESLSRHPLVNYHIVDRSGTFDVHNSNEEEIHPIAVTWGVFPGREIVQPTVVDPEAFRVWKDEAFSIWTDIWADMYEEGSKSRRILQYIRDNYVLVNLVDNQFTRPTCLFRLCREVLAATHYDPLQTDQRQAIIEEPVKQENTQQQQTPQQCQAA